MKKRHYVLSIVLLVILASMTTLVEEDVDPPVEIIPLTGTTDRGMTEPESKQPAASADPPAMTGNGQGMLSRPDGTVYVGELKAGLSHGKGKVTYPGGARFEGQFSDGWPDGEGICTYSSGKREECTFIMGQRQ